MKIKILVNDDYNDRFKSGDISEFIERDIMHDQYAVKINSYELYFNSNEVEKL